MKEFVCNGDQISEYMKVMYTHLNDFVTLVKIMESHKENVIWESKGASEAKQAYELIISEYIVFANKLMLYVDYLEGYVNGYDELVEEVKEHFKKMNEKYKIEEKYGKDASKYRID